MYRHTKILQRCIQTHTHICTTQGHSSHSSHLGQLVHQALVAITGTDQPQALESTQVAQDTPLLLRQWQEGLSRQQVPPPQGRRGLGLPGLPSTHQPLVGSFLRGEEISQNPLVCPQIRPDPEQRRGTSQGSAPRTFGAGSSRTFWRLSETAIGMVPSRELPELQDVPGKFLALPGARAHFYSTFSSPRPSSSPPWNLLWAPLTQGRGCSQPLWSRGRPSGLCDLASGVWLC